MTTTESVQYIANAIADIERRAHKNISDARGLRDDFKAISESNAAPVLLTSKYYAELVALTTGNAASLLDLHYRMTEDAKALGIDMPPAEETEGGDIGVLGGGDR
jgi:hypothetical protein